MANCVNYNCTDLGEHTPNNCNAILLGGISSLLILMCDHVITDPSNATQVNAAIADGTAILVEDAKIGVNAPSPVTIDSDVAGQPARVVNYDRSGTLIDANVSNANVTFYNDLFDGRAFGGLILYEVDADQVTWIDKAIRFTGGRIIPNDVNDRQRFEGTFAWKSLTEGAIYSAPVGVFS